MEKHESMCQNVKHNLMHTWLRPPKLFRMTISMISYFRKLQTLFHFILIIAIYSDVYYYYYIKELHFDNCVLDSGAH